MEMPINEKYMLTIREASAYFNIGIKQLRCMAQDNLGRYSVFVGNRYLIVRPKFEEFISGSSQLSSLQEQESARRTTLSRKDYLTPDEAVEFFGLSRRKFCALLDEGPGEQDFVLLYHSRRLIIRTEFEQFLERSGRREELTDANISRRET